MACHWKLALHEEGLLLTRKMASLKGPYGGFYKGTKSTNRKCPLIQGFSLNYSRIPEI